MRDFEFISEHQANEDGVDLLDILPSRATKRSAGYDIISTLDFTLNPGEEIKIPTGLKVKMQENEVLFIVPKSGLGFKYYTRLANTIGVIDSDYHNNAHNEGHIWVKIRNDSLDKVLNISRGQGIAQGIFLNYLLVDSDSGVTETRSGGFGSTEKLVKDNR